jgi:HPr kinase/phosphorylase
MRRDAAETSVVEARGRARIASRGETCTRLHASCVELQGIGVVLLGASGSGKSDLALRLIDGGAQLVADDQLTVERRGGRLFGRPAPALAGLLEVRGFGIVRLPWQPESRLRLVVELQPESALPRLPAPDAYELVGVPLPHLRLDPRAPSAAAKVRLALAADRVHPGAR